MNKEKELSKLGFSQFQCRQPIPLFDLAQKQYRVVSSMKYMFYKYIYKMKALRVSKQTKNCNEISHNRPNKPIMLLW